jgi:hypothetical protein
MYVCDGGGWIFAPLFYLIFFAGYERIKRAISNKRERDKWRNTKLETKGVLQNIAKPADAGSPDWSNRSLIYHHPPIRKYYRHSKGNKRRRKPRIKH